MFLGPVVTCNGQQWPGAPSACTNQTIAYTVQADGSYTPINPNGWFPLDAKALLP
jgi:branched-chain amino acid transport system substrate-binding protein